MDAAGNSASTVSNGATYAPQPMDALQFGKRGARETGELYWTDASQMRASVKDVHPELTDFRAAILYCPLTTNLTNPRLVEQLCMVLVDYQVVSVGMSAVEFNPIMPTPPMPGLLVPMLQARALTCTPW